MSRIKSTFCDYNRPCGCVCAVILRLCRQLDEVAKLYFTPGFSNKEILSLLAYKHIPKPSVAFCRSSHMRWLQSHKINFSLHIVFFTLFFPTF